MTNKRTELSENEITLLTNKFGRLDIEEEEHPRNRFNVGLLDVFDRQLTNKEAIDLIVTYTTTDKEQKRKYFEFEKRFLSFFEYVFAVNKGLPVYIYSPDFYRQKRRDYHYAVKALKDKTAIKLYKRLYKQCLLKRRLALFGKRLTIQDHIFKVSDIDNLRMFAKLSITECCFSNFFFERAVIIGNYELTLPVYYLDQNLMKELLSEARKVNLYIR